MWSYVEDYMYPAFYCLYSYLKAAKQAQRFLFVVVPNNNPVRWAGPGARDPAQTRPPLCTCSDAGEFLYQPWPARKDSKPGLRMMGWREAPG